MVLTPSQIEMLTQQGCSAEDWAKVKVAEGFAIAGIRNCAFRGTVVIEKNVFIANIGSYIANYHIESGAYIENVGVLECVGESCFGNGVVVEPINENGGRTVKIFDHLSAQIAYMVALYNHIPDTIAKINGLIDNYTESVKSTIGKVGKNVRITNSNIIRNVRVEEYAQIEGVSILSNGSILSKQEAPIVIGADTKMYDFIVQNGSYIANSSFLRSCFVGQSVKIDNFTAINSLFFANSHFENCEACSIFAGPFTVSHHTSSLLIAGMFSFFNAGSGTNQSNHLFKTGAVHQGIHQRGCKFTSNGYVMLPCKNGAFTVVIGRHRSHADTENFPYSYLIENNDNSYLMPAQNLISFGTVRDIDKWAKRDGRKGDKIDKINFEECNPFIGERFEKAISILSELVADDIVEEFNYGRMKIKERMAKRGLKLYLAAQRKFIGSMLEKGCVSKVDGRGHWIDVSGQYMPKRVMNELLEDIVDGRVSKIEQISERFENIMSLYQDYSYSWALDALGAELGHTPSQKEIDDAIVKGKKVAQLMEDLTNADREKDFGATTMIGYGIDAEEQSEIVADFNAVRN